MNKRKRPARVCFNPFKDSRTCNNKSITDLRPFPAKDIWKFPDADTTSVLCTACRKLVVNYTPAEVDDNNDVSRGVSIESLSLSQPSGTNSQLSDCIRDFNDHALETFLNISPIRKRRMERVNYQAHKLDEIHAAVNKKFQSQYGLVPQTHSEKLVEDHKSMLGKLKRVYDAEEDRSVKLKLLSILPKSWSSSQIQSGFQCSKYTALASKKFSSETLEKSSRQNAGNQPLSPQIKQLVIDFYGDDLNSRELAGMRDVKSVKMSDGKRENRQKRLILSNLRELYKSFKAENPSVAIKFAKFATLRPEHCVIAGSSGTHTVCVCTLHQNVKMMLEGCRFSTLIMNSDWIEKSVPIYGNLLKKLLCNPPTEQCYTRVCEKCPDVSQMTVFFQELFDDHGLDEITYKKWTSTDRCTIINVIDTSDRFVDALVDQLKLLLKHDHVAKAQSQYYANLKNQLVQEEIIVILDFAENYAFVVQEAVQAFHFNNNQATILPIVVYYRENNESKHCSFVGISDCLKHDYVTVYLFQLKLITFLKGKFPQVKKIHYFSDGAPQQFKNKNAFTNLCYHFSDFDIIAEWNFFATSHGKGPCDGLAGTIKRLARKASLQMGTKSQILTPRHLFEWASTNLSNVTFEYLENIEYLNSKTKIEQRSLRSKTVKGTQSLHSISPVPNNLGTVILKPVSNSETFSVVQVFQPE